MSIVVPWSLPTHIRHSFHYLRFTWHPGETREYDSMQRRYYYLQVSSDLYTPLGAGRKRAQTKPLTLIDRPYKFYREVAHWNLFGWISWDHYQFSYTAQNSCWWIQIDTRNEQKPCWRLTGPCRTLHLYYGYMHYSARYANERVEG